MHVGNFGGGRYQVYIGGRALSGNMDGNALNHLQEQAAEVVADEKFLQNLVDMGFDKEAATNILRQTNNDFENSLDQLIQA